MNNLIYWMNNDSFVPVIISFLTGFLFSGISWGIIYVIIFLLLYEFLYILYLDANYKSPNFIERLTIIFAAFLGYLLGAILHEDDDFWKHWRNFGKDCNKYGENFDWW